ncbi:MAG: hypothetical protein ABMA15_05930 [Vicinamibacterales bacterium]
MGAVSDTSRVRRAGTTAAGIMVLAAIVALVFAEPSTPRHIGYEFLVVATGPLQFQWAQVRSTGPVRRTIVLLLFVAMPIVLVPAYSLRPRKTTRALTAVGVLLWTISGFLMMALHYVD